MLYANFDGEEPAHIRPAIKAQDPEADEEPKLQETEAVANKRNFRDFRYLFLEDEFVELVDLIMENTFFNIIQETTRKECDLLRVSKTFVMPNNK